MNEKFALAVLAAVCMFVLCSASVAADGCPSAGAGKGSFVVERGPDSKTEVFYGDGPIVRLVFRSRGRTLLETTSHEGLFELDRLDRGQRRVLKPRTDLGKFFPLKLKQKIEVGFDIQENGKLAASLVKLTVIGIDNLNFGACKYDILKIQRDETGARLLNNVDYYAPALKLVVAKEYKERDGRTTLIKFDKIYSSAAR